MTRSIAVSLLVLIVLTSAGCRSSNDPAVAQEKFGVQMAKMNLWREAMFRFQRAVELNPEDAQAYNNLAVAYEANGDFDAALKAYREAMRLDRSNEYIQKNYSRFVEFTTRDRRRQQQQRRATTTTAAAAAAAEKPEEAAGAEPPVTPPVAEPEQPPTPAEAAAAEDGNPAPTAAAPAATPAPNPAPPQAPPQSTEPPPPGGIS